MTQDRLPHRVREVQRAFYAQFGGQAAVVARAPGRVNLIGEHTDYNDGLVLPMAIERCALVAADLRADRRVQIHALDLDAQTTFRLDDIGRQNDWSDYPRGVAWALQAQGKVLAGINAVFSSDVPVGAGLSSSAAVEVAFACAWQQLGEFTLARADLALACQRAENGFVGVSCGIMDQFIAALGQAGHALLIDCRSLAYQAVPVPEEAAVVICDSLKRRGLVGSAYNERRKQCESAVRQLQTELPGITALRDVSPADLSRWGDRLPDPVRRRARHVVHENTRVLDLVEALHQGNLTAAGGLMNDSHISLRDDYQVSCAELDALVEAAWAAPGCYGSRMTGAGFGGCTVSLVAADAVDAFSASVRAAYRDRTGLSPQIYLSRPAQGASVVR
ncbi:MAG: galactokinase [Chloroflexota bacterium]